MNGKSRPVGGSQTLATASTETLRPTSDESAALVRARDVAALAVPVEVSVPATIEAAATLLEGVGGLLSAGYWGTAAIVYAFTDDGGSGLRTDLGKKLPRLTLQDFTDLGIRGLTSRPSVRKYRRAWQDALDRGWAEPAEPGERVTLPTQEFAEKPEALPQVSDTPQVTRDEAERITQEIIAGLEAEDHLIALALAAGADPMRIVGVLMNGFRTFSAGFGHDEEVVGPFRRHILEPRVRAVLGVAS